MDINEFDVAIGALVLPPAIAVVNQLRWPPQLKGIIAFLVCAGYALLIAVLRGPVDFADWRNTLLVVAGSAFIAYRVFWHPSGIAGAIEGATSPGEGPRRQVAGGPRRTTTE